MIFWEKYKAFKKIAENALLTGHSDDFTVLIAIREFQTKAITREKAIEEIINILSDGEHYK